MRLNQWIDHTLLRPDSTAADVERLCAEALEHGFANVCVNGCHVARCARLLSGSPVGVVAVVGFPLGAAESAVKVFEAERALACGAREIDMVQNLGALRGGELAACRADIEGVVAACASSRALVKVILETALLSDSEKVLSCELAERAGAHFVKTSTGFAAGGATCADVALLRRIVGGRMGIKASGGIRDAATARSLIAAGATRLGTSASVAILAESGTFFPDSGRWIP
jgi:deoxyribose-phosphate aldolase